MPDDNMEAYKEMYEMGKRLMEMAEEGGYSPDADSEEVETEEEDSAESSSLASKPKDKIALATSFFNKSR